MQLELLNDQGQATSKFEAPETVFGRAYNEDLVHQVVVAFQANARQGTRAQKDREQVHHSTKKPFKQKGTGRARAGMTSWWSGELVRGLSGRGCLDGHWPGKQPQPGEPGLRCKRGQTRSQALQTWK